MLNNLHNFSGQLLVFFERAEKIPTSLLNLLLNPPTFFALTFIFYTTFTILFYVTLKLKSMDLVVAFMNNIIQLLYTPTPPHPYTP